MNAPRPILTLPAASKREAALMDRLRLSNDHVRSVADVLTVYIDQCRAAGVPGAAKAIANAIEHLHVCARLNERVMSNIERESSNGRSVQHEIARTQAAHGGGAGGAGTGEKLCGGK